MGSVDRQLLDPGKGLAGRLKAIRSIFGEQSLDRIQPVGIESAVGDYQFRLAFNRLDRRTRGEDGGMIGWQAECFVIKSPVDLDATGFAFIVLHLPGCAGELLLDLIDDALSKIDVVATSLSEQTHSVGDYIRRGAPFDDTDIARANPPPLVDRSMPPCLV